MSRPMPTVYTVGLSLDESVAEAFPALSAIDFGAVPTETN